MPGKNMGRKKLKNPCLIKISNLIKKEPRRAFVFFLLLAATVAIILRLFFVMILDRSGNKDKALEQITNITELTPRRGDIADRNGVILASSSSAFKVSADLSYMRLKLIGRTPEKQSDMTRDEAEELSGYTRGAASKLSVILGMDEDELYNLLNLTDSSGNFLSSVNVKSQVEIGKLDEIKKISSENGFRWLVYSDDTRRFYPNGNLMAHVLGFTGENGEGLSGVELIYDEYLKGVPGLKISETDSGYEDIPLVEPRITNPVDGAEVILTLDENIQALITKTASEALEKYNAKGVTIIVSKPQTGEILGMVNVPDFDPNNPREMAEGVTSDDLLELWRNKAIESPFEPGSTFKIVTMSAALSEGLVSPEWEFYDEGFTTVDGIRIENADSVAHGYQFLADIMKNSSNAGFIKLGLTMGAETLYKYIMAFGGGHPTGIDLPNESYGVIKKPIDTSDVDLATISIGQTNNLTSIQTLNNLNTLINLGRKTTPHVVKEIKREKLTGEKEVLYSFSEKETADILDDETAKTVLDQLKLTGDEGGSMAARPEGMHILGKTGTAEKIDPHTGTYEYYISSFLGAAPADDPLISLYIAVDSPEGASYGSVVSAPFAKIIFEEVLRYLGTRPL